MKKFFKWILLLSVTVCLAFLLNYAWTSKWRLEWSKKELPHLNPTSYIFNYPLEVIRDTIINRFNTLKYGYRHTFVFAEGLGLANWRDSLVSDIFQSVGTERDIVLLVMYGFSSYCYRRGDRGCRYKTRLQIHFDSLGACQTRVSVIAHDRKILSGYRFGFDDGEWGIPVFHTVEPTTVEEYQLLYNIGYLLGETDMPSVVYPKGLSKEDLWRTFLNDVMGWKERESIYVLGL